MKYIMLEFQDFEEKTIHRKEIFHGNIIDVCVDEVQLPDGSHSQRELVFHPGGVAIIAITDEDKMVFVKQFRKPLESVILEIPAGKIDPGENIHPLITGQRELEEEVQLQAKDWELVAQMYLSPGFANEQLYIYHAKHLSKVENPKAMDEDEVLEVYELTLEEAKQAILNREICDAKTIFAIQYWENLKFKEGR